MHSEFIVLEVRRGRLLVQPLDGVKQQVLKVAKASKFIENEVIVAQPLSEGPESSSSWEVIASRVDPSFIVGEVPRISHFDDEFDDEVDDEVEYEFARYVSYEEIEEFDQSLEILDQGDYVDAARRLRAFIQRFPYHIDSYHHLGIIETDLGRRARGLKYFEMGYRIGLRSIPEVFLGKLPWSHLPNRPFLRAAHGYGLGLERERRHLEAVEVYEQILQLNPADNLGIRYLLPSLYLKARAPQKARNVLEQHGSDGMNLFTRCLLEVQNGHHREAIRWLCRGLSYNPYLPEIILERKTDRPLHGARFVAMGSRQEAAEYLETNSVWLRREARNFLRQLLDTKPISQRIERAKELDAALDHNRKLPPGETRSAKVTERFALFDEQNILEILEECREMH